MIQLSLADTQFLVDKYVKSLGQRAAARALTKEGYRSPEGKPIQQGHISRVQNGSWTCFLAPPEEPAKEARLSVPQVRNGQPHSSPNSAPVSTPKAAYSIGQPTPEDYLEIGPSSGDQSVGGSVNEVRQQLRDELEAEEAARQEKELNLPPLVPSPRDHSRAEHSHVQSLARPHAVFSRREPVEIMTDEEGNEECFFGIPKLKHRPPATMSHPYQAKSFGQNVVSTR